MQFFLRSEKMFSSGMADSMPETSGVGTVSSVPMRFVWRYGGRRVYLTGSFTRWSDHILMSPMEGCPTVFQVVCSVLPGYHQYKFYVDGQWRHDENEPCISGDYGIVNTIMITREPEPSVNTFSGPDTPGSRTNMEVDNENFDHVETMPRITEDEITASRHRISVFLSTHTAYELLPESGKVIALDVNLPVKQAFHILYEQGIPGAPLWDSYRAEVSSIPIVDDNNSLVDIYSRSDITALAKDRAYVQIHLDEMSIHQALQLGQDMNSPYGFYSGQRCQMCLRTDPLHKVMERLAHPGVRRVVIVEAGSKRVEGIVSLSDVFNFLLG
ncbi:Sucrose nonfermenting 4-like protein [Nymphaea thermarum]|nr:Sucrose nonfermenting 4-like protein [Nymphaea thermarum]